jgi:hypothetical protein
MAITLRTLYTGSKEGGRTRYVVDAHSADVTGLEILVAAASAGGNHLEYISIQCPSMAAGEWVYIQDDATLKIHLLGDMGGGLIWAEDFSDDPIPFAGAIKIDQQAADPIHVLLKYFTVV